MTFSCYAGYALQIFNRKTSQDRVPGISWERLQCGSAAVGLSADAIRQLALLVIADVAGRASNQLGHGVSLHELGHIQSDHGFLKRGVAVEGGTC